MVFPWREKTKSELISMEYAVDVKRRKCAILDVDVKRRKCAIFGYGYNMLL
jgi:hypothetical protein